MRARITALLASLLFPLFVVVGCWYNPQAPDDDGNNPYKDNQPPEVVLMWPLDGATLSGQAEISVEATDNIAVDHVEFFMDKSLLPQAIDDTVPYSYVLDTTSLPDSSTHTIFAKAFDTSLNFAFSDTAHVTIDNSSPDTVPPVVSISNPENGSTVSGTVTLVADATDNVAVAKVEFFIDGSLPPDGTDYDPPYQYTWNTTGLPNGSVHTIYARATDGSGNHAVSATVQVTVENTSADTTPPVVSMAYPADGDTVSGTITLLADATDDVAIYKVEFFIDDVLPTDGTEYNYPYEHVWNTLSLDDGSVHSIYAKATDTSGNYSYSDTIFVTIYNGVADIAFSFSVAADMRSYTGDDPDYFRGACEAIASVGPGQFMISPGDEDPPADALYTIQTYISSNYPWYPIVGNHEAETGSDMSWLRSYNANGNTLPNIVNVGPQGTEETTYSFDYGNVHFVVINEYYDGYSDTGTDGDVVDELYNWIAVDLAANTKPIVFVIGHEPAYPMPDEDNGRLRHENDSLNQHAANRDRFWNLLSSHGVTAYFCGHTHNYSVTSFDGVLQVDVGHARGLGDTGARSTFMIVKVMKDGSVRYDTYRLDYGSGQYVPTDSGQLASPLLAQTAIRF